MQHGNRPHESHNTAGSRHPACGASVSDAAITRTAPSAAATMNPSSVRSSTVPGEAARASGTTRCARSRYGSTGDLRLCRRWDKQVERGHLAQEGVRCVRPVEPVFRLGERCGVRGAGVVLGRAGVAHDGSRHALRECVRHQGRQSAPTASGVTTSGNGAPCWLRMRPVSYSASVQCNVAPIP